MATTKEINDAYNQSRAASQFSEAAAAQRQNAAAKKQAASENFHAEEKTSSAGSLFESSSSANIPTSGLGLKKYEAKIVDPSATQYPTYEAQIFKPATSQADSINQYYDQYIEAQKQTEKAAYDESVKAIEYEAAKLAPAYKAQREALAAEREIADRNFRQSALASGINTGAGSQYALASGNAYQANMTAMRQAEAQALADVEEARRQQTASYQSAIAKAVSEGNLARAQQLYQEAVRVDESIVATAQAQAQENYNAWQAAYTINRAKAEDELAEYNKLLEKANTLAAYGDFSGYKDLGYSQSQINAMYALWKQQNTPSYGGGSSSGGSSKKSSGSSGSESFYSSPYFTSADKPGSPSLLSGNNLTNTVSSSLANLGLTGIR